MYFLWNSVDHWIPWLGESAFTSDGVGDGVRVRSLDELVPLTLYALKFWPWALVMIVFWFWTT